MTKNKAKNVLPLGLFTIEKCVYLNFNIRVYFIKKKRKKKKKIELEGSFRIVEEAVML